LDFEILYVEDAITLKKLRRAKMADKKVTILDVQQAKEDGRKLVMMTAYDYPFGLMADEAGVDIVLVGDSLGMVVMVLEGTVEVGMEHMSHHI